MQQDIAAQRKYLEAQQELSRKRELLICKQSIVEEVFLQAKKELEQLTVTQRKRVLEQLWEKAKQQMTVGSAIVARKDKEFIAQKKVKTIISEDSGGFILFSKDGRIRIDLRFETLLNQARSRHNAVVCQMLFGDRQ